MISRRMVGRGSARVSVVSVMLTVGACGGGEPPPAPSPTTYTASPLGAAVSLLALSESEQAAINREADALIAECMHEQGFEYDQPHLADTVVLDDETDPVEWATQNGYGIVSSAVGAPDEPTTTPRSQAEQSAYDQALYGTGTLPADEGDVPVAYDWRQEGCLGTAYHEATDGADEVLGDQRFAAFFEAVEHADTTVDASEEVAALHAEWAECIADRGHPGPGSPAEAEQVVREGLAGLFGLDPGSAAHRQALDRLRADEVELALADLHCQVTVDYQARHDQALWTEHAHLAEEFADDIAALIEQAG